MPLAQIAGLDPFLRAQRFQLDLDLGDSSLLGLNGCGGVYQIAPHRFESTVEAMCLRFQALFLLAAGLDLPLDLLKFLFCRLSICRSGAANAERGACCQAGQEAKQSPITREHG